MADKPAGRRMLIPYSNIGQMYAFPWKFYWSQGRTLRYLTYAIILTVPIFYNINKFVNGPGNVTEWKKIREARKHDPFAPPTEHGGKHH